MRTVFGRRVWLGAEVGFAPARIVIEGSHIVSVEANAVVDGCSRGPADLVFESGTLYPGFIDAHTHVGIDETEVGAAQDDTNERGSPIAPHLRARDAINPRDPAFRAAFRAGVTTVMVTPGSANPIGGQTIVVKTVGGFLPAMVVRDPAGIKFALGENPKKVGRDQKRGPHTRMGTVALIREALVAAQNKRGRLARGESVERDLPTEALIGLLERRYPARIHAHRDDDIVVAVELAREFGLDHVIEHGSSAARILPFLVREGTRIALGPTTSIKKKIEVLDKSFETHAALARAGVLFSIITDHPVVPIDHLPLLAGMARKAGLSEGRALAAITEDAARLLDLETRIGRIAPGLDADLALWDGDPLEISGRLKRLFVNGAEVDLESTPEDWTLPEGA